jgi:hypothetical protein
LQVPYLVMHSLPSSLKCQSHGGFQKSSFFYARDGDASCYSGGI